MTRAAGPIIICFGVVDEADIVEYFIEYHLALGIDGFVATDVGSTDGTLDILDRYARRGCLHLLRDPDPAAPRAGYDGYIMVEAAKDVYRADWCLCCDADEFWVFGCQDARAYFASVPSPIAIFPRYNVVPSRDAQSARLLHFAEFSLLARRPLDFRYDCRRLGERETADALLADYPPEILRKVAPKVAARADSIRSLSVGFHDAVPSDPAHTQHYVEAGYIAHFPARSPGQWQHKAELVSRYLVNNPPELDPITGCPHSHFHWVRLSALLAHGLVGQDFARQVLSVDEIEAGLRGGLLSREDRVARRVARLRLDRSTTPRGSRRPG
jgi:glycosyltransferase involved in cell wall biosynthesis